MLTVLGASGFVGSAAVEAAVQAGQTVRAHVRKSENVEALRALGAEVVVSPTVTAELLQGSTVVIDLIQPKLPDRLTESALQRASVYRVERTKELTAALASLGRPPLLISVSGTDDLNLDETGAVSHRSTYVTDPRGFARIGIAVRRELLESRLRFVSVHLGTVYGAGKSFSAKLFPALRARKLPRIGDGSNRIPLVHVQDAARALVFLAKDSTDRSHPWVVTDGAGSTQRELLERSAKRLSAPMPRRVPLWLARLVAGRVAADAFSRDLPSDPSALRAAGFQLVHPTLESGLEQAISDFEALEKAARAA